MVEIGQEQIETLQEKLKKMSPEELKEFQKKNCIFCQIIAGKVASKKVYEDDKCIAILDINPANPGHMLLLPKEHYAIMPLIPEEETKHLGMVAKALSLACLKALKAQGTNIFVANGIAAGQKAQHFMMHIIPRMEGDNIGLEIVPVQRISKEALLEIKSRLQPKIDVLFGKKKEEAKKETIEIKKDEERAEEKKEAKIEKEEYEKFVASKSGKKYHVKECIGAKKIGAENKIAMSKEEFEKKGYEACSCVTKQRKKKAEAKKEMEGKPSGKASLDDIAKLFK